MRNQIIALITNVVDRYIYQTFHTELQDVDTVFMYKNFKVNVTKNLINTFINNIHWGIVSYLKIPLNVTNSWP